MSFKDVQDSCRESSRKAFEKEFGRRCITSFTSVGLTIISEIESIEHYHKYHIIVFITGSNIIILRWYYTFFRF